MFHLLVVVVVARGTGVLQISCIARFSSSLLCSTRTIIAVLLLFKQHKRVSGAVLGAEYDRDIQNWAKILGTV